MTLPAGLCLCRGACKPWEILASFPKGYEMIMEYLLQRLIAHPKSREPSSRREISPLIVWRGPRRVLGAGGGSLVPS